MMIRTRSLPNGLKYGYDTETGFVYRKYVTGWKQTGLTLQHDYLSMGFGNNRSGTLVHRVIFWIMTGRMPDHVDHINHNKTDNRWSNLREVDNITNHRNKEMMKNNKSGVTGVHQRADNGKWVAQLNGQYLGSFEKFEDAVEVRKNAMKLSGYHANHGLQLMH